MSGERDPVGVAAERGDVLPYPAQGRDLVEQAPVVGVGGGAVGGDVAETLEADAVVEGDDDQTGAGERVAVEVGLGGGTEGVGAAVDPDQDGQGAAVRGGRPDVDGEDVLVAG
ncbi:hypothetical protein AMK29_15240 [Streptomyces sp. CB02261]|nr:hypothetical protein AMK29_15240 [Streptomyces sp. CB02261]